MAEGAARASLVIALLAVVFPGRSAVVSMRVPMVLSLWPAKVLGRPILGVAVFTAVSAARALVVRPGAAGVAVLAAAFIGT